MPAALRPTSGEAAPLTEVVRLDFVRSYFNEHAWSSYSFVTEMKTDLFAAGALACLEAFDLGISFEHLSLDMYFQ